MASILYEQSVCTVSRKLSPFTVEVEEPPKLSVSHDRRFSASSNEERVRVEGSLNMFTTVKPLSVGTFLMRRSFTARKLAAVSRIRVISSAE